MNAFLDDGSDTTYIRSDLVPVLGCKIEKVSSVAITTLVGRHRETSGTTSIVIESQDGRLRKTLHLKTLNEFCSKVPTIDANFQCRPVSKYNADRRLQPRVLFKPGNQPRARMLAWDAYLNRLKFLI